MENSWFFYDHSKALCLTEVIFHENKYRYIFANLTDLSDRGNPTGFSVDLWKKLVSARKILRFSRRGNFALFFFRNPFDFHTFRPVYSIRSTFHVYLLIYYVLNVLQFNSRIFYIIYKFVIAFNIKGIKHIIKFFP